MGHYGTRERIYQAPTSVEVVGRMEDELHAQGWLPLTRERRADGSLRVVYERVPDPAEDARPDLRVVPRRGPMRDDLGLAVAVVVTVCAVIVAASSWLAFLITLA
jgi:hypothetical protein